MAKIRLTKEFNFEMAHALKGYDGACRHIHGHSYRLFVTVIGEPVEDIKDPKLGMVLDFGVLKNIVNKNIVDKYDHAFVIRKDDSDFVNGIKEKFGNVIEVEWQPTCENMITSFAEIIKGLLPESIKLHHIKLHETATSFAEWYAEDNQ